jgi:formylglycine-generating enzyme required for sulfatase activity
MSKVYGNVWEWCGDVYDPLAYSKRHDDWIARAWTDADAGSDVKYEYSHDKSSYHVHRGGSWDDLAGYCRSAGRFWYLPGLRYGNQGFRVCLVPARKRTASQTEVSRKIFFGKYGDDAG